MGRGNHLSICLKTEENECRDGRSQELLEISGRLASSSAANEYKIPLMFLQRVLLLYCYRKLDITQWFQQCRSYNGLIMNWNRK
jgi:hypothetical protein